MYKKHSQINGLISLTSKDQFEHTNMYIKYGLFVISLTGSREWYECWAENDVVITSNWE